MYIYPYASSQEISSTRLPWTSSTLPIMHFNTVAGLALSLAGSASAFYTPKLPPSGLCPNNQYWDTAKGCKNLPPPAKCSSSNQYYDTLKGCVRGKPPSGPPGLLCTVVKTLVTVARQQLPASSFCSSYLSIPLVTKTATVTAYTKYDCLSTLLPSLAVSNIS